MSVAIVLRWPVIARANQKIEAPKNDDGAYVLLTARI